MRGISGEVGDEIKLARILKQTEYIKKIYEKMVCLRSFFLFEDAILGKSKRQ